MPILPPNPVTSWSDYYQSTLSKPLHPLFSILEPHLLEKGSAIDLGCGVGHAVKWLAGKGWTVTAIDGHEMALEIVQSRLSEKERGRVETRQSMLEDALIEPGMYDLVVASYSLFFVEDKARLAELWNRIQVGLKPGGIFLFELLGLRDDWADRLLTHSADELSGLLKDWEVIHLEEAEQDGHTSQGMTKHWHVYHVIAKKS